MTTLKQFFEEQKQYKLSDDSKLQLYHRVLQYQQSHSLLNRVAQRSKIVLYTSLSVFLVGGFLFITQQDSKSIVFDKDGIRIEQASQGPYRVSADSIGQVLQFQGSYTISNNGKFFETNMIYDGDTIALKQDAFMTFQINGHTTKVVGPAQLEIFKKPNAESIDEFFVHIVEGEFIEVETQDPEKDLIVQKNNIAIHKTTGSKQLNVQITEEEGNTKIRNLGDTVQIDTADEKADLKNHQEALIAKESSTPVTVDDKNAVRINIAAIADPSKEIVAGSGVVQTGAREPEIGTIIAVLEQGTETIKDKKDTTQEDNTLTTQKQTTEGVDKTPSMSDQLALIDGKIVPNEEQAKNLDRLLQKNFLEFDVKNLMAAMIYQKENGTNITLKNINTRLVNLGQAFNLPVSKGTHINIILSNSSILIQHLSDGYHIPPVYIHNLVGLQQWIIFLQNKELTPTDDTIDMDQLINKIYQERPELHFK